MPVQVLVHAYDNPTLASKYQEHIAKHMAVTAKQDMLRQKPLRDPGDVRKQRPKTKQDDAVYHAVIRYLRRNGPLMREELFRGLRKAGLDVSRDQMMHALLYYREVKLVVEEQTSGKKYWLVAHDPEPVFMKEKEKKR